MALAFPDFNLYPFAWFAVALLILALLGARLGEGALCGLLFGAAFYTVSVPWIYTVMHQYGPLPVWEAAGVMILMILAASPYFVVFGLAMAWISRRRPDLAILVSPFLWVSMELARARMPDIGFPWNLLGYAAARNLALVQLASLTGIYGLSLLIAVYNALIVWLVRGLAAGRTTRPAAALASLTVAIVAVALFGGRFVPVAHATDFAHLVQTDLPQSTEYPANWDALHAADMVQLDAITVAAGLAHPGLVVWPEVPAPFSLGQPAFAQRVLRLARDSRSDFLLGVVEFKPVGGGTLGAFNSAAMISPAGREEFEYDKIHLVPFSEYVPWRDFFFFAKDLTGLVGEFHSGSRYSIGRLPGGSFGVFICYEAVFPHEIRRFVQAGSELLINLSNDGWFGRSAAPAQHLVMARVRAVENRRWLLRDTNNGLTASVDAYGRVIATMAPDTRGELDAPYAFRSDRSLYSRWGDWLAWLCSLFAAAGLLYAGLRPEPAAAPRAG